MFAALCILALSLGMALVCAPARALAAEDDHADHTGWTEITANGGELPAGNYYHNGDVILTTNLTFSGEVTLCLNDHVLTGNGNGSVITVNSGSNFTLCDCNSSEQTHTFSMKGGTIAGNYAFGNGGGGVYLKRAAFTMEGGMICGNYASTADSADGGGVYVGGSEIATFTIMGDAVIKGNSARYGGGVTGYDGCRIVLNGGTIEGNSAQYGGGVYMSKGSIEMRDGAVVSNNSAPNGGGIYLGTSSPSVFTMFGGSIAGNRASRYGGGVCVGSTGSFEMKGGSIVKNECVTDTTSATAFGAGVHIQPNGKFTMNGGEISQNSAYANLYAYGGVSMSSGVVFTMNGGKIADNTASVKRTTNSSKIVSAGVSVRSGTTFNISGSPEIVNNISMGEELYDCNVYIAENQAITVVSELTSGASVGVSLEGVLGLFATDYSKYNTADPSEYFFADNDAFAIVLNDSDNPVVEQGTYTVVYVGPDGTETQNEYTVGAEMTLAEVTAEEGKIGGWTLTEGGNSIDYTSGQNFAEGLGNAHGEVITLYVVEVRDLDTDVDEILSEIEDAVTEVNEAIENGAVTDLQGALVSLINAYKAADDELAAADTALKEELTSAYETAVEQAVETLETAYEAADADLQAAIDALKAQIGDSSSEDISGLANKIEELTEAYQAADLLIDGKIDALESADASLSSRISSLSSSLSSARSALQKAIDRVAADLETAKNELEAAIDANAKDVAEKLVALQKAFEAADAVLEGKIGELGEADKALQAAIDAIDAAYRAADEALAGAIEELRAENAAQNDTIARQEEELNSLSVVLWVTLAVAVVAFGVGAAGLVFGLKAKKKD